MKTAFSETYRASKTFNAPLKFVYDWCTDFAEDDLKIIGSKNKRILHEKTNDRVIWTVEGKSLTGDTDPVRVVWLSPPNAWHLGNNCVGSHRNALCAAFFVVAVAIIEA